MTDQEIVGCLATEFSKYYQVPRERIGKWFTRICCYSISSGTYAPGYFRANLEDFKRNRKSHEKNSKSIKKNPGYSCACIE